MARIHKTTMVLWHHLAYGARFNIELIKVVLSIQVLLRRYLSRYLLRDDGPDDFCETNQEAKSPHDFSINIILNYEKKSGGRGKGPFLVVIFGPHMSLKSKFPFFYAH